MANAFEEFGPPAAAPAPRKSNRAPAGGTFYDDVRSVIAPHGGRITSTNGGRHNVGSTHYSGGAVDVGMGRETPEQQETIKSQLLAAGYEVRDERSRTRGQAVWSGPHLHVTRPRGGSGGGGGGGTQGAPAVNPFAEFDAAPTIADAVTRANPFAEFDGPDFSDVQTASSGTAPPSGLPALPAPVAMSGNGDIPQNARDRELGAIYTDKRGTPRRWTAAGWEYGDNARETTLGEFAGGAGIDLVQGLTRAPESLLDLIGWATGGESLLTPEGKAGFEGARQTLETYKPAAYRAEQASPIVQRDEQGGIDGFNLPTGESLVGTIAQSLPQIPQMIYGGGGLKTAAQDILPNAPKLASVLGYGTANAGMVAPGIAEQARTEALKAGYTPEEAQAVANKAMAMAVPLTAATGGIGEGLAGVQGAGAKSLVSALLRGAAIEAPTESIEEAGSSAIGDIALGKKVDRADALEAGIMAAFGGGIPGAAVAGTEYMANRGQPAAPASLADLATTPPTLPAVAAEGATAPRQGDAPAAPPTPAVPVEKQEVAPPKQAAETPTLPAEKINTAPAETAARLDMAAATRSIDDRLAALDEAAAAQIPEAEVSALNAERQELDDLVREQDRAKREGIVQPLESRLSPEERATADSRRQEITATLERHRAARTAADQAQRLRTRLENTDSDAGLYEVAREINPTLGTPQAESFRTPAVKENSAPQSVASPPAAPATPSVPVQAPSAPIETSAGTTPNVENVGDRSAQSEPIVGQRVRSEQPSAPPAAAPETGIPVSPRAESQREPAQSGQQNITGAITAPERQTSLKNAVTDAERVAEGRDPIIRAARKGDRATVDEAVRALRETPSIGRETAARLAEGGPVELKDEAVLLVHKVDLRKRRDAAAERAQSPNVSEEARAIARREYDDAVQQIDEVDQAASRIGTESGRLLQLRKRMIAEDYSMPALERKLRMVVNRDLKPAEQAEIKELADKVSTLQRKLDAVESQQASAQVAEMLARLMKQAPGKNATLAERRAAAMESKAALSAMSSVRTGQQSIAADIGKPGQARAALADRLGRGVVARLERAGVLEFDERSGGTWDGTKIGIGNVAPENALGVLLHEVTHANMLDVLGEQGYERALRDLDALEAAGDPLALKAKRRAAKSGETGQRLDDERIAYMVEEATNAAAPTPKVTEFVRSLFSAFRRWAATSAVFRALEKIGVDRPTLKPADFAAFARKGLDRMVAQARKPVGSADADRIRKLETQLRTDYKTGIRNQRAFDEDADLGWKGVAAMDMDGLKKVNDQLGHDAGDAVLRALANELAGAENTGARFYRLSGAGDEFAGRFKTQADADRMMTALQEALDGLQVEIDLADADGRVRYYTYQGIGISYGTGADYGTADTAANQQKADRLAAGVREAPRADGPSRRIRESAARPGGRREGDPPAVGAQRSIPDQTQTPAFRRWFGDSKVVDANGDPLVVYHGTTADVEAFDLAYAGSDGVAYSAPAIFATSDPNIASDYARNKYSREIANAMRDFQRFKNENDGVYDDRYEDLYTKVKSSFERAKKQKEPEAGGGANVMPLYMAMRNPLEVDAEGKFYMAVMPEAVARAVADGRDGLIVRNVIDHASPESKYPADVFIVFRPEQIKSATANRGTFDPADPNIMRSIPEGEDAAPAGADPVAFFHLARMGAFHYADGARTESEWTKRMDGDLGPAADRYRSMLPDAFKASKAQADRVAKGPETVAEAVEAIGDQRRPRDVKRVVRAVVAEGMRGEDAIISATAQALDMDDADVRTLFVQSESQARTLTEAQAELKDLRKQLRDAQKPDPETRYQDTRARDFQRRIAELEGRITAGDFAKREKTERDLIERNKRLQFELEKTKERFHRYALEAEFQNRTPVGKIFGETVAGINFARAIMTSLDLSAILRQGGKISFGHPLRALKAVPGSLKAFVSEDADFRIRQEIESRPNAPLYKKFGLELTSIGGDALSRTEEAYASRWVDKLPTAAGGGLIRGSGRSYTAFLNRLRADSFDAMLAALARDGSNPTKEEGKAIANYINVATGRGKVGKNEKSGEVLNTVFFAPRLVASRFQLLAGQPLYGGSNRTRKMIAMEYARFLIGVSVAISLAMLMRDEDDETKPIELDPRSVNFGKVRFGDTFLDPLAGLAQVTVFLARVASGETRGDIDASQANTMAGAGVPRSDRDNGLKALRDQYRLTDVAPGLGDGYALGKVGYRGKTTGTEAMRFLRTKLAPVPSAIWTQIFANQISPIGEKETVLESASGLVVPMSVGNLVDVMEAQGMARGTAINLLGILGMSVQYRKSDEEKAVEEENGVAGAFGFGTADRSTDEQP